ncbi:Signal transduction histidine-protein kinase/phosphatase MprB OS=Streptomyces griseomycini OX=66895 GN=FHS37_006314 PE=4 SV=1 [Streptomyces griseomycini]
MREERRAALEAQAQPQQPELTAPKGQEAPESIRVPRRVRRPAGLRRRPTTRAGLRRRLPGAAAAGKAYDNGQQAAYEGHPPRGVRRGLLRAERPPAAERRLPQRRLPGPLLRGAGPGAARRRTPPSPSPPSPSGAGTSAADGYRNGYPAQYPAGARESESGRPLTQVSGTAQLRVPGPAPSEVHDLTEPGLPRRGSPRAAHGRAAPAPDPGPREPLARSRRSRAGLALGEQQALAAGLAARKPKAGGVTSSACPGGGPRPTWCRVPPKAGRPTGPRSGGRRGRLAAPGAVPDGAAPQAVKRTAGLRS